MSGKTWKLSLLDIKVFLVSYLYTMYPKFLLILFTSALNPTPADSSSQSFVDERETLPQIRTIELQDNLSFSNINIDRDLFAWREIGDEHGTLAHLLRSRTNK
ncbi:hypothetical protein TNIN_334331 [Trichonephila inaurata madagascariensis]|uniref:Uncharacterized protein n=1 Tax=Trichonephila inaurata madagascariensis TaxID=2747483 RepID=A0A8X6XR48_9ARAC|nr:hypothetical protein TNIN_334331 [Trichonephila inaurata madagascariensis]